MEYHLLFIFLEILIFASGFVTLWFYRKKTFENTTNHSELYTDYLQSTRWEELRKQALERAEYHCELCHAPYQAIHHVKYPQRYIAFLIRDDIAIKWIF